MCRSIKQLRRPARDVTEAEIEAAALQFVRKVSGYRAPSRANGAAFEAAVAEVAGATRRLLEALAALPPEPHADELAPAGLPAEPQPSPSGGQSPRS